VTRRTVSAASPGPLATWQTPSASAPASQGGVGDDGDQKTVVVPVVVAGGGGAGDQIDEGVGPHGSDGVGGPFLFGCVDGRLLHDGADGVGHQGAGLGWQAEGAHQVAIIVPVEVEVTAQVGLAGGVGVGGGAAPVGPGHGLQLGGGHHGGQFHQLEHLFDSESRIPRNRPTDSLTRRRGEADRGVTPHCRIPTLTGLTGASTFTAARTTPASCRGMWRCCPCSRPATWWTFLLSPGPISWPCRSGSPADANRHPRQCPAPRTAPGAAGTLCSMRWAGCSSPEVRQVWRR
jgi:hypothetical protein